MERMKEEKQGKRRKKRTGQHVDSKNDQLKNSFGSRKKEDLGKLEELEDERNERVVAHLICIAQIT